MSPYDVCLRKQIYCFVDKEESFMGNIISNSVEAYNEASNSEIETIFGMVPVKLSIEMIGILRAVLAVFPFILFEIPDEVMKAVDTLEPEVALEILNKSAVATEIASNSKTIGNGCKVESTSKYEVGCLVRHLARYKYLSAEGRVGSYTNLLVYNVNLSRFTAVICIPKEHLGITILQLTKQYQQVDMAAGQFNGNQQLRYEGTEPVSRRMHLNHNFRSKNGGV